MPTNPATLASQLPHSLEMKRRCESADGTAHGTVVEMRRDGWAKIDWDGVPGGPVDVYAPFTKGHVVWAVAA